jgi:hypothetical protein
MLYKPLISLVMAFAAASSVAAAAVAPGPVGGDHTPAKINVPSIATNGCQGHVKCCKSLSSQDDSTLAALGAFEGTVPTPDPNSFGKDCVDLDINNHSQWYP